MRVWWQWLDGQMAMNSNDTTLEIPQELITAAARWAARLQSSDASPVDHAQFQDWLDQDPRHVRAYDEFDQLWTDLQDVPLPPGKLKQIRRVRTARRAGIAGLGMIAMMAVGADHFGILDRISADHYTRMGETRQVVLPDGTQVSLNSDSAIKVAYSSRRREVVLLRGEAFFDVHHNADRPFVVTDDQFSARAVGTRYGVREQSVPGSPDVQVEEGVVEVTADTSRERVMLHAGEGAFLSDDGTFAVSKTDVSNETAWRDGKLVFSNQPLCDVLATLEKHRFGKIVLLSDAAGAQKVSGIFDLSNTDQALSALVAGLPIRITLATDLLTIIDEK
ncbi:MAG: FecR family protein [Rhodospirillales bacterium]|nr:FecR family protein [Rhodospirillales bacterium]